MSLPTTMSDTNVAPNAPPAYLYFIHQTCGLLAFSVLIFPTLILHTVLHFIPSKRPYPTWSLARGLSIASGRLYLACVMRFSLPRPQGKKDWQNKTIIQKIVGSGIETQCIRIPPAPFKWITGVALVGKDIVHPAEVPGFITFEKNGKWNEGNEPAKPGEKVIMYIAGGSWVMGHPMGTPFPYHFCRVASSRVLSVNHRKALSPETAFPAQLLDALAGYIYLLSLGFEARNIILVGDSSGAHIHLGLARYLADLCAPPNDLRVELPGALMLVSPSVNLSHPPADSIPTDFLVPYINRRAYPSLARHFPSDALQTNPYFSPGVAGDFSWLTNTQRLHDGLPHVWIQHGDSELLTPDQRKWVDKMQAEGVEMSIDVIKGGAHLDAGIAYALLERGEDSSWNRLLDAIRKMVTSL